MENRTLEPENTPLDMGSLLRFVDAAATKQATMIQSIDENERYRRLQNWTTEQIQEIAAQGRIPYNFAQALTKLLPISSDQRLNKTDIKVKYRFNPANAPKAELATLLLKDTAQRSNYQHLENEWFDDGLMVKFGCMEVYHDPADYLSPVKLDVVDYKNIIWDSNSVKYELDDALFVAKLVKKYRFEIESLYGTKLTDTIPQMTQGISIFQGRNKDPYFIKRVDDDVAGAYDVITLFEFYHRANREMWCLVFPDTMNIHGEGIIVEKYETRREAEENYRKLNWDYIVAGKPLEGSIHKQIVQRIDKYEFVYNKILAYEQTEMEDFPFAFYFPIFGKGQFISAMDVQKSPQMWTDRMMSQIDYAFGRNLKNVVEGTPEWLADTETPETAVKKLQNGGIIWKKAGAGRIFDQVDEKMTNPQYLQMYEIVKTQAEEYGGGRSFQLGAEGANESGVAVQKKVERGNVLNYIYKDNFKRSKRSLFKKVLWFIHEFDKAQRIIPVLGPELSEEMKAVLAQHNIYEEEDSYNGHVMVNQEENEMSFIEKADYELEIVEDSYSESALDKKLQRGLAVAQFMPEIAQTTTWRLNILLANGFSYKEAQQTLQEMQQLQAAAQQQQQDTLERQFDLNQQKVNVDKAKVLMDGQKITTGAR